MSRLISLLLLLCIASYAHSQKTIWGYVKYSSICGFYHENIGEFDTVEIKINHWNTTDQDITDIRFEDSSVFYIPSGLFTFENLKYLYMINQNLHLIKPGTFGNAKNLIILDLAQHKINNLYDGVFSGAWNLKTIILNSGDLETIHPNVFSQLPQLEKLDLGSNVIHTLSSEKTFKFNKNLRFLDLDHNELGSVDSQLFANNPVLEKINLNHNFIDAIDYDAFSNNRQLKRLFLNENVCIDTTWSNYTLSVSQIEHDLRFCSMPIAEEKIGSLNNELHDLEDTSNSLNKNLGSLEKVFEILNEKLEKIHGRIEEIEKVLEI
jgi:Leucine-rich repeat (LRR) protein